jgi:hypothetical protein
MIARYFADFAAPYLAEGGQVQPVLGGAKFGKELWFRLSQLRFSISGG